MRRRVSRQDLGRQNHGRQNMGRQNMGSQNRGRKTGVVNLGREDLVVKITVVKIGEQRLRLNGRCSRNFPAGASSSCAITSTLHRDHFGFLHCAGDGIADGDVVGL